MTTKVIISVPHTQNDRAVKVVIESEKAPGSGDWKSGLGKILSAGDTFEEYLYDGRRLVVTEVQV